MEAGRCTTNRMANRSWPSSRTAFAGDGLYLVDEPEAALSPTRQLSLLSLIHDLVLKGSQFIIATHSPILMAYPRSRIYLLTEKKMEEVEYTSTEHFNLTRAFVNDHKT